MAIVTLAALTVRGGKLETHTSGVSYDPITGVVGFTNPGRIKFVPVISDVAAKDTEHYITATHYIRQIGVSDQFTVWSTPLDTSNRNEPPSNFTAIVVGF